MTPASLRPLVCPSCASGLERRRAERGGVRSVPHFVCLGGGTGVPVVLRGLKEALFPPEWRKVPRRGRDRLSAIVTVADDGGSSGRLRRAYRVLAPGDIRNCLLALADGDGALASLFEYRFAGQGDVGGHNLGNLILTALSDVEGDFTRAVERAGDILAARGRVLPSTTGDVTLIAELADGARVRGESRIAASRVPIQRLWLDPSEAAALPEARQALLSSDVIVVGPGSLFTSLLPTLLVRGIVDAIRESAARVVVVMNLMTEPGETDGYTAADHVRALQRHAPGLPIHDVLVHAAGMSEPHASRYAAEGALPVACDGAALAALGCHVVEGDWLADEPKARHDPRKLAAGLLEIAKGAPGAAVLTV